MIQAEKRLSLLRRSLRWLIPAAVVAGILGFVDLHQVGQALERIPLVAVVVVLLLLMADRAVMGLKWRHLVNGAGGHLRVRDAVSIYFQTGFAALLLPTSLGGEALRVGLGRRAGIESDRLVASMIVEKLVGAVSNILLAGLGLVYLIESGRSEPSIFYALIAGAAALAALLILAAMHRRFHKLLGRMLGTLVRSGPRQFLNRLSRKVVLYAPRRRLLAANLVLNVSEHVLQFMAMYILAWALGLRLHFWTFLAATAVVMLVRRAAGFVESFGLAEGGAILLYSVLGVPGHLSVSLAMALWATSIIAALPGAYLLYRSGISLASR